MALQVTLLQGPALTGKVAEKLSWYALALPQVCE